MLRRLGLRPSPGRWSMSWRSAALRDGGGGTVRQQPRDNPCAIAELDRRQDWCTPSLLLHAGGSLHRVPVRLTRSTAVVQVFWRRGCPDTRTVRSGPRNGPHSVRALGLVDNGGHLAIPGTTRLERFYSTFLARGSSAPRVSPSCCEGILRIAMDARAAGLTSRAMCRLSLLSAVGAGRVPCIPAHQWRSSETSGASSSVMTGTR